MKTGTQEHLSRLELARCPTRSLLRTQLYLYLRNPISSIPDSEYLFVSTGASGFDSRDVNANNEAKNIGIEWTHH